MNTKIYINSQLVDCSDDVAIPLTYSIADIREPQKRNTAFSKTVILPGTQSNNQLFGHIWNVNASVNSSGTTNFNPSFNPNLKASAIISYKDVVQFTGIVQLLNVNVNDEYEIEYEVAFLGELGNIFQAIENKTLDEIDLSAYDHLYTAQNQKNSWNYGIIKNGVHYPFTLGEGYVYPMIDYGYNNGNDWNVKHFFPAVYLKTVFDKIVSEAGFQYESNFLTSDLFKRLVIPYSGGSSLKLTDTQIENRTFRATSSGTTTINIYGSSVNTQIPITDESTAPNFDTGNVYNNTTSKFTVSKTGTYVFRFKPKASVTHFPSANTTMAQTNAELGWFRIYKQGVGVMASIRVMLSQNNAVAGNYCIINSGSTVTSGTTTLETTGELSYTSYAYAGDVIYCEFTNTNSSVYSTGANSASNYARLNVNVGSLFAVQLGDTNIQEGDTVEINSILPAKFKQSELFESVMKAFNLFIQPDKLIPNKLYIEPRKDFYTNGVVKDWTLKLDNSKEVKIVPMGELNTKRFVFTYKKDEDYYNNQYYGEYSEVYGQYTLDIENDFLKGEIKNELIFSPTPLVDTLGNDRIIPKIYDVDEQGTIKPKASNIRLLYYGGVKTTNQPYNHIATSGTTVLSTYGYAGHVDNPTQPTIDLSFGVPKEVMYLTDYYTANNLYNVYWKDYFEELIDKNSKIFIGFFHLNEIDINELDFKNTFYFENEYWKLNKVIDYNPSSTDTVKCEFIKLKTSIPFVQDTGVPIKGGVAVLNSVDLAPTQRIRTLSTNSYGVYSFGEYNVLPTIGSGIIVSGNNNSVGEGSSNVTILGSSGVTVLGGLTNVTLINSDNVEVTQSNTSYVNGVQVTESSGTTNYVSKFIDSENIVNSQIFDNGTNVGIGTNTTSGKLDVRGNTSLGEKLLYLYSNDWATAGERERLSLSQGTFFSRANTYNLYPSSDSGNAQITLRGDNAIFEMYAPTFTANTFRITNSNKAVISAPNSGLIATSASWSFDPNNSINASANIHIKGVDSTSSNYSIKIEDSTGATLFQVRNDGVIIAPNLPTSSAGLPTGALWNDSGTIKIV